MLLARNYQNRSMFQGVIKKNKSNMFLLRHGAYTTRTRGRIGYVFSIRQLPHRQWSAAGQTRLRSNTAFVWLVSSEMTTL